MKIAKPLAFLLFCSAGAAMGAEITPLMTEALVSLPDSPQVKMLTVQYEPGGMSAPHRHNSHVFVYVLNGKVEMQVEGGDVVTLEAGQTFYESPTDIHTLSRNASDTEPAKFLVFFVKEAGADATLPLDNSASMPVETR
ncbi:cupin domain-containing protein [Billgrantia antri]|uniref:Cupin domain-containing protein n=1 Tax=Billgrantia antri TaxID=2846777 RepID=A0ABS6ZSH6_9GAMM|nr:cupin domain-containing protein [Halomonas antri]MBW6392790.1 cupin domain-containing protein [Halomonas antri]